MSQIIVQVAETGSGKGWRTKMLLKKYGKKNVYALDPKGQFKDVRGMKFINPKSDLKIILPQIKDAIIVIDEAAIRFPLAATNATLTEALLSCRHNYTTIILNFHALQQVPIYIRNYINIIIIGKTNDDEKQAGKFGKRTAAIHEALMIVNNSHDPHACITIDDEYIKEYNSKNLSGTALKLPNISKKKKGAN